MRRSFGVERLAAKSRCQESTQISVVWLAVMEVSEIEFAYGSWPALLL
jgi:hypothetical protein